MDRRQWPAPGPHRRSGAEDRLLQARRHERLLGRLCGCGAIRVRELARDLGVSDLTIRRDGARRRGDQSSAEMSALALLVTAYLRPPNSQRCTSMRQ
ncbi:DeoR family transcriptional regulator [Actinoplanes siamensis]|uniref:DeoR family transcriptional regulator n=1 Tax=Actinoplanes siamensis TaxID=1223317 RepID=UPI001942D98D|nr:DeoR family transcriptional regulator [Actinoplanes siamensis]